mgnify:CR=1 FL=1
MDKFVYNLNVKISLLESYFNPSNFQAVSPVFVVHKVVLFQTGGFLKICPNWWCGFPLISMDT